MRQVVVNNDTTDWLTPVATLVAVIIGGVVSFGVQRLLSRRREQGNAKAAARVVQGDLAIAASRMKDMVMDDPRWFGYDDLRLSHWTDYQGTLALELSTDDWEVVSQSALELAWLSNGMARAMGPGGPHEGSHVLPLDEKFVSSLRKGWDNATKAWNVLAPLAGTAPQTGLLHEDAAPVGGG